MPRTDEQEIAEVESARAVFEAAIAAYRDLPSALRRLSVRRRIDVPTVEAIDITVKLTVPSVLLVDVMRLLGVQ